MPRKNMSEAPRSKPESESPFEQVDSGVRPIPEAPMSPEKKFSKAELARIEKVTSAESIDELKDVIDGIKVKIAGREGKLDAAEVLKLIDAAEAGPKAIAQLPESLGIRNKVEQLIEGRKAEAAKEQIRSITGVESEDTADSLVGELSEEMLKVEPEAGAKRKLRDAIEAAKEVAEEHGDSISNSELSADAIRGAILQENQDIESAHLAREARERGNEVTDSSSELSLEEQVSANFDQHLAERERMIAKEMTEPSMSVDAGYMKEAVEKYSEARKAEADVAPTIPADAVPRVPFDKKHQEGYNERSAALNEESLRSNIVRLTRELKEELDYDPNEKATGLKGLWRSVRRGLSGDIRTKMRILEENQARLKKLTKE